MLNNANRGKETIVFGEDSIVIQKFISGIPGGRTLDVAGYPVANVFAGSVIIKKTVTTDKKNETVYAPMPLKAKKSGEEAVLDEDGKPVYEYDALPEGSSYAGMLYRTISIADPQASILLDGVVNEELLPYGFEAIKKDFLAAVPQIILVKDEVA